MHLFCAKVDASGAGGIFGLDHEHEDIRVTALPAVAAFERLTTGDINNGSTLIALQWLQLNHAALRADWLS